MGRPKIGTTRSIALEDEIWDYIDVVGKRIEKETGARLSRAGKIRAVFWKLKVAEENEVDCG